MHEKLKKDGHPNYCGLQIPVPSKLNSAKFFSYLKNYWDWQIAFFVKFGFPLSVSTDKVLQSDPGNHPSAEKFPTHVDHYLREELKHKAILGPFKDPPIKLHTSPFLTREKSDSDNRRVIVDLSWPHGNSVNDAVQSDSYEGVEFLLTLPTIDHITNAVKKFGRNSFIAKIDVSRAFRHVPIDPRDIDKLGLFWNDYFIDLSLCFGFKHGSKIYQRLSDSVRFIMSEEKHHVVCYIDDHVLFSNRDQCQRAYDRLTQLLEELGFSISVHKNVTPTTEAICLGILINTNSFVMSIPPGKLEEIKSLVHSWSHKKTCTKNQLQSLLGSLLYVSKVVKFSRFFLNRLLTTLREAKNEKNH